MASESSDPAEIRSIAVTASDVVAALELAITTSRHAVLRLTPPFSGRMRARLHVEQTDEYDSQPRPLHIDPQTLVDNSAPPYPSSTTTEEVLRTDPEQTYTVERHHEYHTAQVTEWRASIPDAISDRVRLETPGGPHEIDIKTLSGSQ